MPRLATDPQTCICNPRSYLGSTDKTIYIHCNSYDIISSYACYLSVISCHVKSVFSPARNMSVHPTLLLPNTVSFISLCIVFFFLNNLICFSDKRKTEYGTSVYGHLTSCLRLMVIKNSAGTMLPFSHPLTFHPAITS